MNKLMFLQNLRNNLAQTGKISSSETEKICDFFTEMIADRVEDGLSEEEAVNSLGDFDEIIKNVLEDMETTRLSVQNSSSLINTADKTKTEKVFNETFRNIILNTKNEAVRVFESPDDGIHLIYTEDDYEEYSVNIDDEKIIIEKIVKKFKFFGFSKLRDFEIYLPKNYSANLNLSTSNSSLICDEITFNEGEFTTSNSNIALKGVNSDRARAKTSNSNILVENSNFNEAIYATTSNSKVKIENVSTTNIALKTSNGKIEAQNIQAKGELIFKSSNANIVFDKIVGYNMELVSSNGKIEGLVSDKRENFSIDSKTSNANSNLGFTSSKERKLIVKTSNGKINVEFSEEI